MKFLDKFSKKKRCMPLVNLEGAHVKKYHHFKTFLNHDRTALKVMAEMEQVFFSGENFTLPLISIKYEDLLENIRGLVFSYKKLSGRTFSEIEKLIEMIDKEISEDLKPKYKHAFKDLVLPFSQITKDMAPMVGAKAANLASIKNSLGLPVPEGFAVTAYAFERFLDENQLQGKIEKEISAMSLGQFADIDSASQKIQKMILDAEVPEEISRKIHEAYAELEKTTRKDVRVVMRSSAVGEDTDATFAGQYVSVLNVDKEKIIEAYKTVLASKYSAKALSYGIRYGLDDRETPMCVACVEIISSESSGVVYTGSFAADSDNSIRISSVWGLGEQLVSGSASPDTFYLDRTSKIIVKKEISKKENKLINLSDGGTSLEAVPGNKKEAPSIDDDAIKTLADYGLALEEFFGSPQDIEWAINKEGELFILQSRPLRFLRVTTDKEEKAEPISGHEVLIKDGKSASPGIAAGTVHIAKGDDPVNVPADSILVAKTASPNYAKILGTVKGLITDIGSPSSHLSSVAREFGVPAIVDAKNATSVLKDGDVVTMSASNGTVYKGIVEPLIKKMRPPQKSIIGSPVHQRLRRILDRISPLNLIDTKSPEFTQEGCKTFHDIIRFTHENAMKAMFGLTEEAEDAKAIRLNSALPLDLCLIDIGGGLRKGLTTCDNIAPEDITSYPMKAIWKGFTHPGISWEGTINFDAKNFMTLLAASAISEFGELPGGTSYAIMSKEYMNFSAKFGYHFATIDALCGEDSSQNYISMQFTGGAGNYYGRLLRIYFIAEILKRLEFQTTINGDLITASMTGFDQASMEGKLDQMGRLLASARLLDMALSNQEDVTRLADAFFNEEYDFLSKKREDQLSGFYTHGGHWVVSAEGDRKICIQDGSKAGFSLSSGVVGVVGKFVGPALQDFLDNIEAYYYFPIAIAKDAKIKDAVVSVRVKPVSGNIDRAGGIAFGLRDVSNYFVFRINALEDNIILFEYINNKRIQRSSINHKIDSDKWYRLSVEIRGNHIKGYLDESPIIEYSAEKDIEGYVGIWTKADSVTYFDELRVQADKDKREIPFL